MSILAILLVLIPAAAFAAGGHGDGEPVSGAATAQAVRSADGSITLDFDYDHSVVGFSVKHLVIATVKGTFNEFEGSIRFDPDTPTNSAIEVVIDMASVDTDNQRRDDHLRSPDFFDVARFPKMTFKSDHIELREKGYVATGDLTIRDVTRQVEVPFDLLGPVEAMGDVRYAADAILEIDRQEFGVKWNRALDNGGVVVSDTVKIELHVELVVK